MNFLPLLQLSQMQLRCGCDCKSHPASSWDLAPEAHFLSLSVVKLLWSMHVGEQFPVDYCMLVSRQAFLVSALRTAFFILQVY